MSIQIVIEKAVEPDAPVLTRLAHASKRHWDYPEEYFEIWQEELTITKDYIKSSLVFKAVQNGKIIGFYSIVENPDDFYSGDVFVSKGYWLEHIFVDPSYLRKGIGRQLTNHALTTAREENISHLKVFVDPYAAGFYDKIGANCMYHSKSSIPGRLIPVYNFNVF